MTAVVGAGAVGLALGARLARAGDAVLFVVRRPEVARAIEAGGVRYEDPGSWDSFEVRPQACVGPPPAAAARLAETPVLLCTRADDLEQAAQAVAAVAPGATVVTAQNDVDNEERVAPLFRRVWGMVVRQTCTRIAPNRVRALGPGRLVLGAHPEGAGPDVEAFATRLRAAGYDVGVSSRIREDKWLKLCVNLMSAPNALVRPADHATRAFVETKARLLEEARDVLRAAGITARSCDGRDRSLEQEIDFQRASLAAGTSSRRLPIYNQVWQALRSGAPLEADRYHRRLLELAAAQGLAAPMNARVLAALQRAYREGLGPESLSAAELFGAGA